MQLGVMKVLFRKGQNHNLWFCLATDNVCATAALSCPSGSYHHQQQEHHHGHNTRMKPLQSDRNGTDRSGGVGPGL